MFEDFLKRFDEIETLRVMTDDWERTYAQTGDIAGALNGHLTAQAYIWYKDGSWMKCTLKKGVLEGPFEWRSKDHRSSMSGEYANGKREGHWDIVSKVSDTVTRSEKCQYKEGHIIGDRPQRIYLEKNRLPIAEFTLSAAGKKTGEFKQYNNDGSLYKKCHYSDGMLDGEYTTYSHGRVRTQGAFSYGARNGEWTVYDKDGNLRLRMNYVCGVKQGAFESNNPVTETSVRGSYELNQKVSTWVRYVKGRIQSGNIYAQPKTRE